MKKPNRTTKIPRTPRIKADRHKDDLRHVLLSKWNYRAREGFYSELRFRMWIDAAPAQVIHNR